MFINNDRIININLNNSDWVNSNLNNNRLNNNSHNDDNDGINDVDKYREDNDTCFRLSFWQWILSYYSR